MAFVDFRKAFDTIEFSKTIYINDSDYYLLKSRIRARISNLKKHLGIPREKYDMDKLKRENEKRIFEEKLTRKLEH